MIPVDAIGPLIVGLAILIAAMRLMNQKGGQAKKPSSPGNTSGAFCRSALLLGIGIWCVLLVIGAFALAVQVPQLWLVFVVVAVAGMAGKRLNLGGWAFGTARWSETAELMSAGYLRGDKGLLVGQVRGLSLLEAIRQLRSAKGDQQKEACRAFRDAFRRKGAWVRIRRFVHGCCFGPAGAGKTTGVVIPVLMTDDRNAVVMDMKGELYKLTAAARRAMGHKIVVLDPFGLVGGKDTLNPLAGIDPASPTALDICRAIAEALTVRTGEEREPHWNDSAQLWMWAMIALVLLQAPPDMRNLQTVCTLLSDKAEIALAIKHMKDSTAWGGMLARLGGQLEQFVDRELGSTLTTTNRHLSFLATPAVAVSTTASTFDPDKIRTDKVTIYLVMPPEHLRSQSPLLRLWVSTLLRGVVKGGASERNEVMFLLDEAAALGHMDCIDDAVTQLRGYGVRLFFFYQSMGQLETCFPKGKAATFLSNMSVRLYFGINDIATAQAISEQLGEATIQIEQQSGGNTYTQTRDAQGMGSTSVAENTGWSISETARKLLKPEEILQLNQRQAIVFAPGVRPFVTRLVRYYEVPEFKDFKPEAKGELTRWCLGFAAVAVVAAVGLAALALNL